MISVFLPYRAKKDQDSSLIDVDENVMLAFINVAGNCYNIEFIDLADLLKNHNRWPYSFFDSDFPYATFPHHSNPRDGVLSPLF